MGKQNDDDDNNDKCTNQKNSEPDDSELKVLIEKCNVCHSNLNVEEQQQHHRHDGKFCMQHKHRQQHGEI